MSPTYPIRPVRSLMTPAEVGERLGMTTRQVYQAIHHGPLVARRLGPKLLRILPGDFEAFAVTQRRAARR